MAKSVQVAKQRKSERSLNNYLRAKVIDAKSRGTTAERRHAQKNEQLALLLQSNNRRTM